MYKNVQNAHDMQNDTKYPYVDILCNIRVKQI